MGRRRNYREPTRVTLHTEAAADGHRHVAVFDERGDGWTTTGGGSPHYHVIRGLEVRPAGTDRHTHELSAERAELDELDEVPAAAVA